MLSRVDAIVSILSIYWTTINSALSLYFISLKNAKLFEKKEANGLKGPTFFLKII